MQTLLLKLMLVLAFLIFPSCQTIKPIDTPQKSLMWTSTVIIDGKEYIPMDNAVCMERTYHFGPDRIGSIGDTAIIPTDLCNKIVGWTPVDYADVYSYWESVRKQITKTK